jgi:hypothetical protein
MVVTSGLSSKPLGGVYSSDWTGTSKRFGFQFCLKGDSHSLVRLVRRLRNSGLFFVFRLNPKPVTATYYAFYAYYALPQRGAGVLLLIITLITRSPRTREPSQAHCVSSDKFKNVALGIRGGRAPYLTAFFARRCRKFCEPQYLCFGGILSVASREREISHISPKEGEIWGTHPGEREKSVKSVLSQSLIVPRGSGWIRHSCSRAGIQSGLVDGP